MHRSAFPLVALAAAAPLLGCAHEQATLPVASTPAAPDVSTTQTTSQITAAPAAPQPGVNVSDEILKACQIHFENVDTAPKFDFDKSDLRPGERDVLQQVARCVTTGPLAGRSLRLVGRADPRGEVEYNFVLGAHRAGSAEAYLQSLGVDSSRLTTTSRGKLDATGTDEPGWQVDRRVDLELK